MIFVDIIFSLVFMLLGYVGMCCYFEKIKITGVRMKNLALSKSRIVYLAVGVFTIVALIACLNIIYDLPLITRLNLLSLALLILPVAAIDLQYQKIPNVFLLVGTAVRCVFFAIMLIADLRSGWQIVKDSLIGALIIGVFFLLLLLAFKNSIGMGDVKLFAIMGLYQGLWGVINSVFFSLLVSFFLAIVLLITKKKGRKDTISFGPSIYLGTIIAMCMAGI